MASSAVGVGARQRQPGRCGRGQAAPELLAAIPIVLAAGLVAWQLVAALWAGVQAQERLRAEGLRATGESGQVVTVRARVPVPGVLPGLGGLHVEARAAVRAP